MQIATDAIAILEHGQPTAILLRLRELQGQGGLFGERGRQPEVGVLVELLAVRGPAERQDAGDRPRAAHRQQRQRRELRPAVFGREPSRRYAALAERVVDDDRLAAVEHLAGRRVVGVHLSADQPLRRGAGHDLDQQSAALVPQHHRRQIRAGDLSATIGDQLQRVVATGLPRAAPR